MNTRIRNISMFLMVVILAAAGCLLVSPMLLLSAFTLLVSALIFYRVRNLRAYYLFTFFSPLIIASATFLILYRITVGPAKIVSAEMDYPWLNIDFQYILRNEIENSLGNRWVHLRNKNWTSCYISRVDYKKLHPESTASMLKKNYTIIATLKMRRALGGGYTIASVVDTLRIVGKPHIHK